jgi:DNA (cytosine-5)-methyltransferase 1
LHGDDFDASEDGNGRGTPLVPTYTLAIRGRGDSHDLEYRTDGTANAILTPNGGRAGIGVGAIAFDTTQITSPANYSNPRPDDPCHPLARGAHAPAIAFDCKRNASDSAARDVSPTLRAMGNAQSRSNAGGQVAAQVGMQVRRLTPKECARLQGFPDDYLDITFRGKPAADGPKYKALGNSMAVPVMRWIGERIAALEALDIEQAHNGEEAPHGS